MKRVSLLVALLIVSNLLIAQTFLFEKGESGFDVNGSFSSSSFFPIVDLGAGYTFNGNLNIGASDFFID